MEEQADKHHLETPQDIADVAAYVNQLDSGGSRGIGDGENATEARASSAPVAPPVMARRGEGDASRPFRGSPGSITATSCARCTTRSTGGGRHCRQCIPRKIAPLDFEEVRAVADYLSRIEWSTRRSLGGHAEHRAHRGRESHGERAPECHPDRGDSRCLRHLRAPRRLRARQGRPTRCRLPSG